MAHLSPSRSRGRVVAYATAALLAVAGGVLPGTLAQAAGPPRKVDTFKNTGAYDATVPAGYTQVHIQALGGGAGGSGGGSYSDSMRGGGGGGGGGGAYVSCNLTVQSGQKLAITVGGGGGEVTGGVDDSSGTDGRDGSNSDVKLAGKFVANADRGRSGRGGADNGRTGGGGGGAGEARKSYCRGGAQKLLDGGDGSAGNPGNVGAGAGVGGKSHRLSGCYNVAGDGGNGGKGGYAEGHRGNGGNNGCVVLTFS
jgi:hypothetical protein